MVALDISKVLVTLRKMTTTSKSNIKIWPDTIKPTHWVAPNAFVRSHILYLWSWWLWVTDHCMVDIGPQLHVTESGAATIVRALQLLRILCICIAGQLYSLRQHRWAVTRTNTQQPRKSMVARSIAARPCKSHVIKTYRQGSRKNNDYQSTTSSGAIFGELYKLHHEMHKSETHKWGAQMPGTVMWIVTVGNSIRQWDAMICSYWSLSDSGRQED